MEIAKKVQESHQKVAAGFCVLRDKAGHWIGQSVSVDQNQIVTPDANLAFHPCEAIRADLEQHQILVPDCSTERFGYAVNTGVVQLDGVAQDAAATVAPHAVEQHQERHR